MNIYLIILITILFPLVFTAILHVARLKLYKDIKIAEPFVYFELPRRSKIIDFKNSTVPHNLAKGLSKLNKDTGSFEIPSIQELSRINTYLVVFPNSYTIEKLEDFLVQGLYLTEFKIFFQEVIESARNNLKAWNRFLKGNYSESELLDKSGFNYKERFLYISTRNKKDNQYLNFTGFYSSLLKRRLVLIITLSSGQKIF
jgi:hypothetical protein